MTHAPLPSWQLAGLETEPVLGPLRLWRPSRVELRWEADGERLVWWWPHGRSDDEQVDAPTDLLLRFVRLTDAKPGRICDFASRWGLLGICEHGLPCSHNPPPLGAYVGTVYWCEPRGHYDRHAGKKEGDSWEPLEAWHLFAGQARALLNVAAKLHNGKLGDEKDWKAIYSQSGHTTPWWKRSLSADSLDTERSNLARVVNKWLLIGNVRPTLAWGLFAHRRKCGVSLQGRGLFGVLAVQLLMAVSRTAGLAVCSECGNPYAPLRRPRADRGNYCPDCGLRAAWRAAQRKRRATKPRKKAPNVKASRSR